MFAFVCSAFLHVDARERLRVHVRNLWCWSAEPFFDLFITRQRASLIVYMLQNEAPTRQKTTNCCFSKPSFYKR